MTVLILGAGGLLGSVLVRTCLDQSRAVVGTYHTTRPTFDVPHVQHDIRDTEAFESILAAQQPTVVINCAALTGVDDCESQREAAARINGAAPGALAAVCADHEVPFVQISTDYVFDGESTSSYAEHAPVNPIQTYGKTKLTGEGRVQQADGETMIVRLSFVYGVRGDTDELVGFPAWVDKQLADGDELPLFVDQQITPSRAGGAATTILALVDTGATGIYHVATRSCVTPYQFAREIVRLQNADETLLTETRLSDMSRAAPRPAHTCLDVSKVENEVGHPQPTLEDDLRAIAAHFDS